MRAGGLAAAGHDVARPATTSGTSGDATTTAPPAPAALVLSTSSIALGAGGTTASLSVTNQGGQSATLTSTTSTAELTVSNGGANRRPGLERGTLTITLDRGAAAEGERTYTVSVGAPGATGGGQVVVTAAVDRAPIITSIGRTPSTIRTSTSCGQTLTRVSVGARTDESGVASVSVLWSSDGVFAQRTALSLDSSGHWTAQVGSFSATGTRSLPVEVTDTHGNHSSGSTTVVVVAC